jgi:hypothetical protein
MACIPRYDQRHSLSDRLIGKLMCALVGETQSASSEAYTRISLYRQGLAGKYILEAKYLSQD